MPKRESSWHSAFFLADMGKSSQRKGADGERELVAILRERGYDVERGGSLTYGEIPDLTGLPGVHIEVKRVERLNVGEAMSQAIRDSERFHDGAPALFHRRSRAPWLVTMRLEDWLKLYESSHTACSGGSNMLPRSPPDLDPSHGL